MLPDHETVFQCDETVFHCHELAIMDHWHGIKTAPVLAFQYYSFYLVQLALIANA